MGTTRTLAGTACCAALLLGCGSGQPHRIAAPLPAIGAQGYYALGSAEHAARRYPEAKRAWTMALRLDPRHADARNGMAVLLAEEGNYDDAIALWRKLVDEGGALPRAEQAFLTGNLGYALYLRGDRDEALTLLRQACVLAPHSPLAWEHLATVLEALGATDEALRMMKQARTLRAHDIRADYALAGGGAGAAVPVAGAAPAGASPWPAQLGRTELRQAGGVVEVHHVAAPAPAVAEAGAMDPVAPAVGVRLEISNGNGVRGMAAAWARRLRDGQWKSVRLTNARPFAVPVTRIEYRTDPDTAAVARALAERLGLPAPHAAAAGGADLRIVLGWDQRGQAGKESAQGARRAP